MAGQGFASKTKDERMKLARKAGKAAHQKGKAHQWDESTAKKASQKALATRKRNAALKAAQKLILNGFSVQDLTLLKLSADELAYYGGPKTNPTRIEELRRRLNHVQTTLQTSSDVQGEASS